MPVDYTRRYLVRKDSVSDDVATPAKEDAANQLPELWGLSLSEIAQHLDYSRQHIKNTVDGYFVVYDDRPTDVPDSEIIEPNAEPEPEPEADVSELPIDIPDDVDRESYIKGYVFANDVEDMDSFYKGYMKRYLAETDN